MWLLSYNILFTGLFLLALPFTPMLLLMGRRFSAGLGQRLGFFPAPQVRSLQGVRPVWIHAASVGEVRSVQALVRELKACHPHRPVLLSTFTLTGNQAALTLTGVDAVIFVPLDLLWIVRRALRLWNPALMIFVETEIWPNFLGECFRRGIPTVLVSGRLSPRSFPRYEKFRGFFRQAVGRFAALGMQSGDDAARMVKLGAEPSKVSVVGSLKLAGAAAAARFAQVPRRGKKILVAGSTHEGEEEVILSSFAALRPRFPELALVLAPRHPQRFEAAAELLERSGFSYCRRSRTAEEQLFSRDILLLDTLGELNEFFACADIAFVGGSLVDIGGHNIIEPAQSGKPIVFGPYMANVRALAEQFKSQGAAIEVADGPALAHTLGELLADDDKRRAMGAMALAATAKGDGAVQRNFALAARYL